MNKPLVSLVGWFLLVAALGFYLFGIGKAIHLTLAEKAINEGDYSPVLESLIASVQALLLTNLGMLLGISVANPTSSVAHQLLLARPAAAASAPVGGIPNPLSLREKIQLLGLALYVFSLVLCVAAWAGDNFSNDARRVVPLVSTSGKMFFGVALAYLTLVLSNKP